MMPEFPTTAVVPILPGMLTCRALLFDLDGTLADSLEATERHWKRWTERHGIDWPTLREGMHGVPTRQVVGRFAPHLDPAAEEEIIEGGQAADTEGVVALPGAGALLDRLPAGAWAIVTSATGAVAEARLQAAGLRRPEVLVSAADVPRGKPFPEPYLLAAQRLGVTVEDAVVVEDAPAGIRSGVAGGFRVVAVGETGDGADLHVAGVGALRVVVTGDSIGLEAAG